MKKSWIALGIFILSVSFTVYSKDDCDNGNDFYCQIFNSAFDQTLDPKVGDQELQDTAIRAYPNNFQARMFYQAILSARSSTGSCEWLGVPQFTSMCHDLRSYFTSKKCAFENANSICSLITHIKNYRNCTYLPDKGQGFFSDNQYFVLNKGSICLSLLHAEKARVKIEETAEEDPANINKPYNSNNPLTKAAKNNNIARVKLLIEKGADVNLQNLYDETPLVLAAENGYLELANMLIEKGADVNRIRGIGIGHTPLSLAAKNDHLELAKILIEKGANVNDKRSLFEAAKNNHLEMVKFLLEKGANVNKKNDSVLSETPLLAAAENKNINLEIIKLLLEKGAQVNAVANSDNKTPLYLAAENGNLELAKILTDKGALVNMASREGKTPLYLAVEKSNLELAKILIDKGADVNNADKQGRTPLLFLTIRKSNLELAKILLEKGALVNKANGENITPLFMAVDKGDLEFVKILTDKGADVNYMHPALGQSPFSLALIRGNLEHIKVLLNKGADVNRPNGYGKTPLMLAAQINSPEIAQLLLSKGANLDASIASATRYHDRSALEFFKLLAPFQIAITPEMEQFTRLYILNAMNRRAGFEYQQKKDDPSFNQWKNFTNLQREAVSNLGVPFQSPDDVNRDGTQYMEKKHVAIKGVDSVIYQRKKDKIGKVFDDQNRPLLMYIHGDGAENKMTTDRFDPILDYYLAKGYLVVSPNFTAQNELEDIYNVALAFKKNQDLQKEYKVDPNSIFTTSISAGSNRLLRLLTLIGKEKRENPFKASHISTTAGSVSDDDVSFFPKEMDYLIVHGEKDNPEPIRHLYKAMEKNGLHVDAQFLKHGGHHLIAGQGTDPDTTFTNETATSDPRYQDLLKWPAKFITFFDKLTDKSLSYNFLSYKNPGEFHPNTNLNPFIEKEFKTKSVFPTSEMVSQTSRVLEQERKHFKMNNTGVGYHGANSSFVGLSVIMAAIHSLEKRCKPRPNIFRAEENFSPNDVNFEDFYRSLTESLKAMYIDNHLAYNHYPQYTDKMMTLSPALFSGHVETSSPLYFWGNNTSISKIEFKPMLEKFLKKYNLTPTQLERYLNLFERQERSGNGGLFQFLFTKDQLDHSSIIAESEGYSLKVKDDNGIPLSVFEYEEMMKKDPNKLKQMILNKKHFRGTDRSNVDISYPQIRLKADQKTTEQIKVKLYPANPEEFKGFLKKLYQLLQEDLENFSCKPCKTTGNDATPPVLIDLEHFMKSLGNIPLP
ncbi:MAG: ankyrin repeat domain-containing protein [Oligoflexia bacterium]|nr:ankyrin repeat domain-containing protein [Oligoflexia bacterium]